MKKRKNFITRLLTMLFGILILCQPVFAQTSRAIKGTVYDSQNDELIGVSVVVKNTTNGTMTDFNGEFSLDIPFGTQTLVFSYLGMKTQEIQVTNQTSLTVVMEEALSELGEIVVIGYGTQRRESVTGSVAHLNDKRIKEVPATNITQALQGQVAGVEMTQASTKPGEEMQMRIRGTRSLTAGNNPLVVLDGIPFAGGLSDINPNMIKSIDILKDASASAIYGSRGANGVILVTTDRGSFGQTAVVSYSGYFGAKNAIKYPMMNGPEYAKMRKLVGKYDNGQDEADDVDTDWQDLFYRTGIVTNHDVSVSGGTQKGAYSVGIGYYKDEAVVPMQDFSRISLRASIDQEKGRFRFGVTTNNSYSLKQGDNIGLGGILSMSPLADPYNKEDGSWKRTVKMAMDEYWVYTKDTLDELEDLWLNQRRTFSSYNSLYGEVKIPGIEGLKYRINVGLNFRLTNGGAYTAEGINNSNVTNPSSASISNSLQTNWAVENLLMYDRTFAEKHLVNVVALYSAEQTTYYQSAISGKNIPIDDFQYYNLGEVASEDIVVTTGDRAYRQQGLLSWMGRIMYSYDGRYMLSASVRNDGASVLATGHKHHTYPAVSAGWNMRNESFMENVDWVDMVKLRVGYGQTANQAIDPYQTLGRMGTRRYNFGPTGYETGYFVSTLPNPILGWEYTETWNYGVDFSLFSSRLTGSIEYYTQDTKDLLQSLTMPRSSGVGSYMANVGRTSNKGLELSVNGTILDNVNGWTWNAGFNVYANRNKIVSLASGRKEDTSNQWFVGYPIDVIYDYKNIGLWQEGDPYLNILEPAGNVGMIKVEYTGEYNADGSPKRAIGSDDRIVQNIEPNFQGGFNTSVSYKDFDLGVVGIFKNGGTLLSTIHASSGYLNMMSGRRGNVKADYWTPENTGARYPAPGGLMSGDNPKYGSTMGYFDATYLKVRTITLGYNFKQEWLKKAQIDRLRLYFTVQDPFVLFSPFKNETGMNPETNTYGNENIAVASDVNSRLLVIGTNTPTTRNYLFGINLTF